MEHINKNSPGQQLRSREKYLIVHTQPNREARRKAPKIIGGETFEFIPHEFPKNKPFVKRKD